MKMLIRATATILAMLCGAITASAQSDDSIHADVVYGHKAGMALTLDVFTPAEANGAAVLNMVSGGWVSRWTAPQQARMRVSPLSPFAMGAARGSRFRKPMPT